MLRVPSVPSGALLDPLSRAEVCLLGLRWDLVGGMAPPGEALRMAQQWGPAADTPWGAGRRPREASADHTGAGQARFPSPTGQGHGLGRFRGRGCDGGLRALVKCGRPEGLLRGGGACDA